jgi:hypothetical protein
MPAGRSSDPLVALQPPEFNVIQIALHDLLSEVCIVIPRQHDMYVGAIGGHEIGDTQIPIAI